MRLRFDYLDGIMVGCVTGALIGRWIGEMNVYAAALVLGVATAYVLVRYVEVRWRA